MCRREVNTLIALLKQRGYESMAENIDYVRAAVEYIDMQPEDYTIFDWLRDTEQNYPEYLKCEKEVDE